MKYMLAIHADESRWGSATPEEIGGWMAAYQRFTDAAKIGRASCRERV